MFDVICPNDSCAMESDITRLPRYGTPAPHELHVHTCPECGYSESR